MNLELLDSFNSRSKTPRYFPFQNAKMLTYKLELQHNAPGKPSSEVDIFLLEILEETITLAELIQRTVEEELRLLQVKHKKAFEQINAIFARRYLTSQEITQQAEHGKIGIPSAHKPFSEEYLITNPSRAVEAAYQGFRNRTFVVYVNGKQIENLQDSLTFSEQNKVVFLRLMPLVGG
jgi:hypothetical protein